MNQYINNFKNEIKFMEIMEGKNKENKNTVKFYEYFNTENEFVIVMELCDGNLTQLFRNKKKGEGLSIDEIYNILIQLNNSFKIMNEKKIVHRDLKLENILLKYENKDKYIVKLTDYGISRQLLNITHLSTKIGTPKLMAPEILEDKNNYNEKCDLWSLGIIIYRLYFTKYPYDNNTEFGVMNLIKNGKKFLENSENEELNDLIRKLLEKNPQKRINWKDYFNHSFFININREKEHIQKKNFNVIKNTNYIEFNYLLKYIIIGDADAGKSNILSRFFYGEFKEEDEVTIGCEFCKKNIEIRNKIYRIQIWDTAGQDAFRSIARSYYKNTVGVIIVYSITNRNSFDNVPIRIEDCKDLCPKTVTMILVGNKAHKENKRKVTFDEGKTLANKYGMKFLEVSAKTGQNIDDLFYNITDEISKKIEDGFYDLNNPSCGIICKEINSSKKLKDKKNDSNCIII